MITTNQDPQLQLVEADRIFIDLVQNRVTIYGQIPYEVPKRLIIDIIKESARYFYRHYYGATEKMFYHVSIADIQAFVSKDNPEKDYSNVVGYSIVLPGYVNVVKEIYEGNKTNVTTSQELISNIALLQRNAPYGQSIMGINNSLYIMEAACRIVEEANYNSIFGTSVPFTYRNLTHRLIFDKTPQYNLLLECLSNIDIQFLYQNDLFIRHVIGRVKQELKRLIASHTIELPGGATLNADEICNNLEDVTTVEDMLKNSGGIGDLIMMR